MCSNLIYYIICNTQVIAHVYCTYNVVVPANTPHVLQLVLMILILYILDGILHILDQQWAENEHQQDQVHADTFAKSQGCPPPLQLSLNDCGIEQVRCFKLLGVVINDTLTWTDHINHVIKKVSGNVNLLRRHLLVPSQLTFLKSYILPHLNYCIIVLYSCSHKDPSRLQFLFNFACRLVLHRPRLSSSTEL